MSTKVVVSLQIEGTHHWDSCNKAEVNYLAHEHRHMFHIKVKKEVGHGDREIEIIKLKHKLEEYFVQYYCEHKKLCRFGSKSCEMLAMELCEQFELAYCEVLEDGENGAEVEGDFQQLKPEIKDVVEALISPRLDELDEYFGVKR